MFLSVQRNKTPETIGLEGDVESVVLSILNNPDIDYFNIKLVGPNNVTLTKVTIKSGPRQNAPAEEIVEIVAGSDVVGSAEVKK